MDLNLIKEKLASQQKKTTPKYEKIDYSVYFWRPKVGKHQVRIVPSKFNKQYPFKEVYFHYGIHKFPIMALTNWGEIDPVVEVAKQMRKSADKEDWQLARKIEPKVRIFVPVIVRGEEDKGVRLWEFGKQLYNQLLDTANDEDYGDYTDIMDGRDFTVDAVQDEVANKKVVKCSVRIKPKTSALSESSEQVEKWLNEQPDILNIYKKYSFDEIKEIIQKYLNPEESEDSSETSNEDDNSNDESMSDLPFFNNENKTYKPEPSQEKKQASNKFDNLFQTK